MKILTTADLHSNRYWYEWLVSKAMEFDLIAIAGDLLEGFDTEGLNNQTRDVEGWLAQIVQSGCAAAVSSGNHELYLGTCPRVTQDLATGIKASSRLATPPQVCFHPLFLEDGSTATIESASGSLIISTIPYKKFGDPQKLSVNSPLWTAGKSLKMKWQCPWLVLHHDPPGGGAVGGMAGDFELRQRIQEFQPDFVISGHLHGQPFFEGGGFHECIGISHCFNAGQIPPTKSRIPNYIAIDSTTRLAKLFYFDVVSRLFREEHQILS